MGPRKVIVKDDAIYDAKTGVLIKDGLTTREAVEQYVDHHYMVLPVVDKAGRPWLLDGQLVFCLHGTQYETVNDDVIHVVPCPDCGGMAIRDEEPLVDTECVRCTQCGHEFDPRLEMMES
ncbi:MAG: hypothetical protein D6690_08825 [Nitrospirae bacterium]|nr:MAG: hypothetical protein D6690_08825 [Nitrospirota bacterium]